MSLSQITNVVMDGMLASVREAASKLGKTEAAGIKALEGKLAVGADSLVKGHSAAPATDALNAYWATMPANWGLSPKKFQAWVEGAVDHLVATKPEQAALEQRLNDVVQVRMAMAKIYAPPLDAAKAAVRTADQQLSAPIAEVEVKLAMLRKDKYASDVAWDHLQAQRLELDKKRFETLLPLNKELERQEAIYKQSMKPFEDAAKALHDLQTETYTHRTFSITEGTKSFYAFPNRNTTGFERFAWKLNPGFDLKKFMETQGKRLQTP